MRELPDRDAIRAYVRSRAQLRETRDPGRAEACLDVELMVDAAREPLVVERVSARIVLGPRETEILALEESREVAWKPSGERGVELRFTPRLSPADTMLVQESARPTILQTRLRVWTNHGLVLAEERTVLLRDRPRHN